MAIYYGQCDCGNEEFYAVRRVVALESVVDNIDGKFLCNAPDKHPADKELICLYEPEGEFICTKCGKEYSSLQE